MSQRLSLHPALAPAAAFVSCLLGVVLWSATATAQVGPEDSLKKLRPAEGLEATLWAAEPMVVNPTTIDIDSRGRVWVTEGLNYRLTRRGNRKFQRIEDADKIKILEDTDGDGKADKVTVFADRIFPVPMGIAVEEFWGKDGSYQGAKVYVGNSPDILVLEDTDGDDKADKRYPLLTGFGGVDSDHGVHGMVLGLDGKLYFTHGDGCCSVQQDKSERTENFNVYDKGGRHVWSDQLANTLRSNRDGSQFEIIADRQRNNYETCLNSFGNQFTSDNDDDGNRGSRVIWVMDGGKYGYRTPGSPRHWGEDVPGNVPKLVGTGNGSPCGVMVYEGDLLPEVYRGAVLEAEAGPRVIYAFPLTRKGAAFRTEILTLLASEDNWFRPVDVCAAPDGSLLVADWYDGGVGGHAFRDQTTGRIYRVAPKGAKSKKVDVDFSTVEGLIAALKSPVVATRDVARRLLIQRGSEPEVKVALAHMAMHGKPVDRARALWVRSAIEGDQPAFAALTDDLPQIREQAVRILGRDVSRTGKVEFTRPEAETPLAAAVGSRLAKLLPMADDPDAGVRRELILALRDLPTAQVGDALRTLAKLWDGRDRWYLEALGLALRGREPEFITSLFDGTLYGDLNLPAAGQEAPIALPPYFPIDRNEAFISVHDPELPPANPLSKTLGLAWEVHRAEVLPLLTRIMPSLKTPELQQAADDVLMQISDPAGAVALASLALEAKDPVRKRQILTALGRKLDGAWRLAQGDPKVIAAIEAALKDPETRAQGIQTAAATGDRRYTETLLAFIRDEQLPGEARAAAVEAIGRLKPPQAMAILDNLIARARERQASDPAAEAAVRTLPRLGDVQDRLLQLMMDDALPLGLRREALRGLAQKGPYRLIGLARDKKLPEALRTEATIVLYAYPDREVRNEAARVLPIASASGKPLPSVFELIRREGKPDKGREVFFRTGTNACGSCHRVQGRGQWVGPDLSTIGTKYGKDELLRSILNPSAGIAYNYRSYVIATQDGQVITGLPVEETPDRLALKTAEGKRIVLRPADIAEKKISEISLMPEGLAQALTEQDLVDLLAFLTTLKQPVSVVGRFDALGPLAEPGGRPALDPGTKFDPAARIKGADGQDLAWRRLEADAEGRVDLIPLVGTEPSRAIYLHAPVTSPVKQAAQLVLDTRADVRAWLGGKELRLPAPSEDGPRIVVVSLPKGTTDLLLRISGGPQAALVATFVADRPVEFSPAEAAKVSAR
ncbi:MAG: c-type cytochrome [Isosphaeraceae bacterium]|nr:c-type cytochrome [Isosphaeraceae bacterium]